jgi:hypothetical protein
MALAVDVMPPVLLTRRRLTTLVACTLVALGSGTNYVRLAPFVFYRACSRSARTGLFGFVHHTALRRAPARSHPVRAAYAPQLGARLHINHTQLNIIGLAGNSMYAPPTPFSSTQTPRSRGICDRAHLGPCRRPPRAKAAAARRLCLPSRRLLRHSRGLQSWPSRRCGRRGDGPACVAHVCARGVQLYDVRPPAVADWRG